MVASDQRALGLAVLVPVRWLRDRLLSCRFGSTKLPVRAEGLAFIQVVSSQWPLEAWCVILSGDDVGELLLCLLDNDD